MVFCWEIWSLHLLFYYKSNQNITEVKKSNSLWSPAVPAADAGSWLREFTSCLRERIREIVPWSKGVFKIQLPDSWKEKKQPKKPQRKCHLFFLEYHDVSAYMELGWSRFQGSFCFRPCLAGWLEHQQATSQGPCRLLWPYSTAALFIPWDLLTNHSDLSCYRTFTSL